MIKNLVIVESPAKAKTIEGFLGKDFVVKSSFGHVRDLAKKGLAVDIENKFQPTYEVSPDKTKVVSELKKLSKEAELVWLATDEDREGEAISWHLFETLGLKEDKTKRIVFHEITKPAIQKAIQHPRSIDKHLVDAQQARRILDRLVGFELSPVLWKKVRPSLSAGRVQSVAVRLIVEREREIMDFKSTSSYRVTANFETEKGELLKAELPTRFKTEAEAEQFLKTCSPASFSVGNLEIKPSKKSPAAPFTTSTLQQEASRKLGFSVAQTMVVAQRLYESGKITYMRTDSVNLSETAVNQAKDEITRAFGARYVHLRQYKTKSKGAQEAHEAIRPTYINVHQVEGDRNEQRLYDLIWKRTIASQMADAELEKTNVTINISTTSEKFQAQGEVLKFDGFLTVYLESTDDEESTDNPEGMLPALAIGQSLKYREINATQRFTHHPPRYTEASLVKKLEELGIGRPSTYAPTISTVQKRGYVEKTDRMGEERRYNAFSLKGSEIKKEVKTENTGAEKGKLFPTDIGMVVNDFLTNYFPQIMDYHFTAKVEEEFDEIAEGKVGWNKMIADFYKPFHLTVEKTIETSERASGERSLGKDPVSGNNVYVRIGRFGPMVQIGESDKEEKPKFASLRKDQRLETITLEEALELFKLPRVVGSYEGEDMVAAIGRFGPYIRHKGLFYSMKKEDDPLSIGTDRAIEIIEAKREAERNRIVKVFSENPEAQILNGRWGPYLSFGENNYKLPKGKDPASLTYDDILELIKTTQPSGGKRFPFKKAAAKTAAPAKKAAVKKTAAKKGAAKKAAPKKSSKK